MAEYWNGIEWNGMEWNQIELTFSALKRDETQTKTHYFEDSKPVLFLLCTHAFTISTYQAEAGLLHQVSGFLRRPTPHF
jgi:hypothetical protein